MSDRELRVLRRIGRLVQNASLGRGLRGREMAERYSDEVGSAREYQRAAETP